MISVSPSEKRLNDHWESVKAALGSFKTSQVVRQPGLAWPPDAKGYLDLYSGTRGVARALVKKGAAWCLCFDIKDGPDQDLECLELRSRIEWLIRAGAFVGLGAGPDCSSFSIAVTPPVRSDSAPYGKAGVTESMKESYAGAMITASGFFTFVDSPVIVDLVFGWKILRAHGCLSSQSGKPGSRTLRVSGPGW